MNAPTLSPNIRKHDRFNIYALTWICCVDFLYLALATDPSKFGTEQLGEGYYTLAMVLNFSFTLYLLVDLVWVWLQPDCVASAPMGIIIHHIFCILLISIPWFHEQFSWHLAINTVIETNTLFLTLRRNTPMDTVAYKIYNVLFYACWISMRLVLYPILVVFFYNEYRRYSVSINQPYNVVAVSFILEFLITFMGFKWTFDMARKQFFGKKLAKKG